MPCLSSWACRKWRIRSEEHTSELQSRLHLVCRLLLEKKKQKTRRSLDGRTEGSVTLVVAAGCVSQAGRLLLSISITIVGCPSPPAHDLHDLRILHTVM